MHRLWAALVPVPCGEIALWLGAGVLVLPSTVQGELVKAFEALYTQPGALPPLMQQGVMEQRIPRHYVLLHDARNSPPGTLERCAGQGTAGMPGIAGYWCLQRAGGAGALPPS